MEKEIKTYKEQLHDLLVEFGGDRLDTTQIESILLKKLEGHEIVDMIIWFKRNLKSLQK